MYVSYGEVNEGRRLIAEYVFHKKQQQKFTVIDVGGSATGWSVPITDCYIDINKCDTLKPQFNIDICKESSWLPVLDYVDKHGKFDYSICTHTLEDIYNPYLVLDMLPKISKAGVITVPSIRSELSLIENLNWLGFIHHRYLFGYNDEKMIIAPKLPLVEKTNLRNQMYYVEEIKYEWETKISYIQFMNNYLGPNTNVVLQNYEQFILNNISAVFMEKQ